MKLAGFRSSFRSHPQKNVRLETCNFLDSFYFRKMERKVVKPCKAHIKCFELSAIIVYVDFLMPKGVVRAINFVPKRFLWSSVFFRSRILPQGINKTLLFK
jgi:hypothetical protein